MVSLRAGDVRWRLEFRHMSSPAARLLLAEDPDPGGAFALFGRVGRSPRVYAARDRELFLRQMQAAALSKMGITLAGHSLVSSSVKTEIEVWVLGLFQIVACRGKHGPSCSKSLLC